MSSECFQNSSASWLKFLPQDTCSVKIEMLVSHMLCFLNVIANKLNLLLFPLKQFAGLYLFKF